jgi:hypothetical protein
MEKAAVSNGIFRERNEETFCLQAEKCEAEKYSAKVVHS